MLALVGKGLFALGVLIGLLVIPIGLPGTAIIFVVALVYALATGFAQLTPALLGILLLLSIVAEVADNVLSMIAARKYGASRRGILLSLLGAFMGGMLGVDFSGLLNMFGIVLNPVVGVWIAIIAPVAGALLVSFWTVYLNERWGGREHAESLRAAWGTVIGRLLGIVLKFAIAIAMMAMLFTAVF